MVKNTTVDKFQTNLLTVSHTQIVKFAISFVHLAIHLCCIFSFSFSLLLSVRLFSIWSCFLNAVPIVFEWFFFGRSLFNFVTSLLRLFVIR